MNLKIFSVIAIAAALIAGVNYTFYKHHHPTPAVVVKTEPLKTCAVIGDSIATGLVGKLPACTFRAKGGMNSEWIKNNAIPTDIAIISSGSNDSLDYRTREGLNRLANRAKTKANIKETIARTNAKKVVLIKPATKEPGELAAEIAKEDKRIVLISFTPSADGVHPSNYTQLAIDIGKAVPELKNIKK